MLRSFAIFLAALAFGSSAFGDVCQIDESVAYAPRAACAFPACPAGGTCPAPELTVNRQASSVELSDPLLTWMAVCLDPKITGGCWQASFETQLRLGMSGTAESVGIKVTTDGGNQPVAQNYYVKPDRVTDSRLQAHIDLLYYVPASQTFSLKIDALCAKGKSGRELCVTPPARAGFSSLAKTASRANH